MLALTPLQLFASLLLIKLPTEVQAHPYCQALELGFNCGPGKKYGLCIELTSGVIVLKAIRLCS